MYRFHMKVYGCQMNVYDSDRVRTALVRRGWEDTKEAEADLVVVTYRTASLWATWPSQAAA